MSTPPRPPLRQLFRANVACELTLQSCAACVHAEAVRSSTTRVDQRPTRRRRAPSAPCAEALHAKRLHLVSPQPAHLRKASSVNAAGEPQRPALLNTSGSPRGRSFAHCRPDLQRLHRQTSVVVLSAHIAARSRLFPSVVGPCNLYGHRPSRLPARPGNQERRNRLGCCARESLHTLTSPPTTQSIRTRGIRLELSATYSCSAA